MKKAVALLGCLLLAGCAAMGPVRPYSDAGLQDSRGNPQRFEREAKDGLSQIEAAWLNKDEARLRRWDPKGLVALSQSPVPLELTPEAVWIKTHGVLLRASWARGEEERSGSAATRHMTDFYFENTVPMTLSSLEGEYPFNGQGGQRP